MNTFNNVVTRSGLDVHSDEITLILSSSTFPDGDFEINIFHLLYISILTLIVLICHTILYHLSLNKIYDVIFFLN